MLTLYFDSEFLNDFWIQYDESENIYVKKFVVILREFAGVFINAFDCYSGDYDPYKVASIIGGTSLPFSDIYVNF